MKFNTLARMILFVASLVVIALACNNGNDTAQTKIKNDTIVKTAVRIEQKTTPNKAPVINITDTVSIKHIILCMKDSAATSGRIAMKLGEIYSVKLAAVIKKNGLKITGAPMAWYKSQKAPFFFEAGFPVDKKPVRLPAGVTVKQIGTDSVVIAHFYGPYNLTGQAYIALQDWIKEHKKTTIQAPYEVYVDDPLDKNGKLKDPYKVQTDIVFTWR